MVFLAAAGGWRTSLFRRANRDSQKAGALAQRAESRVGRRVIGGFRRRGGRGGALFWARPDGPRRTSPSHCGVSACFSGQR